MEIRQIQENNLLIFKETGNKRKSNYSHLFEFFGIKSEDFVERDRREFGGKAGSLSEFFMSNFLFQSLE